MERTDAGDRFAGLPEDKTRAPVLGYRAAEPRRLSARWQRWGPQLLLAAGGFFSVIIAAFAASWLAAAVSGGQPWLLAVAPIASTLALAILVFKRLGGQVWSGYRDGFLAGSVMVLLVAVIMFAMAIGGSFDR